MVSYAANLYAEVLKTRVEAVRPRSHGASSALPCYYARRPSLRSVQKSATFILREIKGNGFFYLWTLRTSLYRRSEKRH